MISAGLLWGSGRSPVGALGGDLVEPCREPLRQPPAVGEDDRALVLLDQVDDVLLDVRPDRLRPRRLVGVLVVVARLGHVLHRDDDLQVPLLGARRRHDLHRRGPTQEPRHLLQRPYRRAQPDPLGRPVEQRVEPLEGDREVGAALGAGYGVHLVDDHRLDAAQALAGLAGEHQEQRLRRGDHDVGRLADEPAPVGGRCVTGADPDGHLGDLLAEPVTRVADAGERAAQVALHVDRERLERADVEHPGALGLVGRAFAGQQLVEAPQERAQRLAGPRRRHHEGMLAGPDRLPRPHLRRRRLRERRREPRARRLAEAAQRVGGRRHGAKSCSRHRQGSNSVSSPLPGCYSPGIVGWTLSYWSHHLLRDGIPEIWVSIPGYPGIPAARATPGIPAARPTRAAHRPERPAPARVRRGWRRPGWWRRSWRRCVRRGCGPSSR